MRDAVAYIRVSTGKQKRSGLGAEAQQAALTKFAEAENYRFVQTFTETESGADDNRPGVLQRQHLGAGIRNVWFIDFRSRHGEHRFLGC